MPPSTLAETHLQNVSSALHNFFTHRKLEEDVKKKYEEGDKVKLSTELERHKRKIGELYDESVNNLNRMEKKLTSCTKQCENRKKSKNKISMITEEIDFLEKSRTLIVRRAFDMLDKKHLSMEDYQSLYFNIFSDGINFGEVKFKETEESGGKHKYLMLKKEKERITHELEKAESKHAKESNKKCNRDLDEVILAMENQIVDNETKKKQQIKLVNQRSEMCSRADYKLETFKLQRQMELRIVQQTMTNARLDILQTIPLILRGECEHEFGNHVVLEVLTETNILQLILSYMDGESRKEATNVLRGASSNCYWANVKLDIEFEHAFWHIETDDSHSD